MCTARWDAERWSSSMMRARTSAGWSSASGSITFDQCERPRPAVGQDQRDRAGAAAGLAHEVHRDTGHAHLIVLVGVDSGLGLAPVIALPPVGDQLADIALRNAVEPV